MWVLCYSSFSNSLPSLRVASVTRAYNQPRPVATLLILTEPWSVGSVRAPCLTQVARSDFRNSPHTSARRHPPDEGPKCGGSSGREVRVCQPPCPSPNTTHVPTMHLHCANMHTHS